MTTIFLYWSSTFVSIGSFWIRLRKQLLHEIWFLSCYTIYIKIIVPKYILQSTNHKHGKIGYYMKIKLYNFQDIFCVIAQKIWKTCTSNVSIMSLRGLGDWYSFITDVCDIVTVINFVSCSFWCNFVEVYIAKLILF